MKKLVTTVIVALALVVGTAACSSGSKWSEADKAELEFGLEAAVALGIFTSAQADCVSNWAQSNYDSMAAMEADEGNDKAARDLMNSCDIDPEYISPTPQGGGSITTTPPTVNNSKLQMCSDASDQITVGLNAISSGLDSLTYASRSEALEFLATAKEFVNTSIDTLELCSEYPGVEDVIDGLYELRDGLTTLEDYYLIAS